MQIKSTHKLIIVLGATLLLAGCAPAEPEPTATPAPSPTPEMLQFDLTVYSTRTDPALERRTGVTWEGGYIWTPFVVFQNDTYYLFYNGFSIVARGVGLATSPDGIEFKRFQDEPVLVRESEERVIYAPVVYVDDEGTWVMYIMSDQPRTNLVGDRIMRYTAPAPEGPWEISNDGEPVWEAPSEEHWTAGIVIRSIVVEEERILLGFDARLEDTSSIGILASADGLHFELLNEEPMLVKGEDGSFEQDGVTAPIIFPTSKGYEMFYIGHVLNGAKRYASYEGVNLWMGYATSPDAITWTKYPFNPVFAIPEEQGTAYISGMKVEDVYHIFYVYGAGAYGIGAASLTIPGQ